jgi:hypothetical protein
VRVELRPTTGVTLTDLEIINMWRFMGTGLGPENDGPWSLELADDALIIWIFDQP